MHYGCQLYFESMLLSTPHDITFTGAAIERDLRVINEQTKLNGGKYARERVCEESQESQRR